MFEQTVADEAVEGLSPCQASRSFRHHRAFRSIVTCHEEMHRVFGVVEKVSQTTSNVLICGESGTGKELIARAIHELSGCGGAFVPVNCGAIPDNLLESELFGYEKGAFTGATTSKPGRFVLADGGTLFLDEVGEMSLHLQVKLLRVLQDKQVEPVGGIRSRHVNARVIAATNVDLRERVREGKFREDLFYRLQVVPIELPSLRERKSDVSLLIEYFSEKSAKLNNRKPLAYSDEVIEIFQHYSWPGNIRELENLIEYLTILVDHDSVRAEDLPDHLLCLDRCWETGLVPTILPETGVDFNRVIEEFENSLIRQALERTGGNKKAAARLLSLNRTTLVEKIKKKGLDVIRSSAQASLCAA